MESMYNHLLLYFDLHLLYKLNSYKFIGYIKWFNKFVIISTITKIIMSTISQENMAEPNNMNNVVVIRARQQRMPLLKLVLLKMTKILLGSFLLYHSKMYSRVEEKCSKTPSHEIFWVLMSGNYLYNLLWGIYWISGTIYRKIILPFIIR